MQTIHEEARAIALIAEVDVLVVGGGPSGVCAAVAAARTFLLEYHGFFGGMWTAGMVLTLAGYNSWLRPYPGCDITAPVRIPIGPGPVLLQEPLLSQYASARHDIDCDRAAMRREQERGELAPANSGGRSSCRGQSLTRRPQRKEGRDLT